MKRVFGVLALLGTLVLAGPASSETTQVVFRANLDGLPVGQMVLANNSNGSAYAAKGEFRTTGLVGLLARVRFSMSARGTGRELRLRSRSYSESLDTGYRTSAGSVQFGAGDRRIDPLTALLAALLDRDLSSGCAFDGKTFDGERTMRLRIRPAAGSNTDSLTCTGTLTRLTGYTAQDLAEWTTFSFTIRFENDCDKLIVRRADVQTIYGKVALIRR